MIHKVGLHCTDKAISVYAMKEYKGSKVLTALILTFGVRWRWMVNIMLLLLYPSDRTRVPTEQEAGWTPEPVWTFRRRSKFLTPARIIFHWQKQN